MSYSSLPLTSKLFQLTSLTCALALAGCGGGDGDTVDSIAPPPDTGIQPGTGGGNTNGGGEQTIKDINIIEDTFLLKSGRYQTMNMRYKCNTIILIMKNNEEHEILKTVKENTTDDLEKLKDDILKIIISG